MKETRKTSQRSLEDRPTSRRKLWEQTNEEWEKAHETKGADIPKTYKALSQCFPRILRPT